MEWDEETKAWIPRWGYKSKRSQKDREWAMEVPDHIDPNTDMFQKRADAKRERVNKNEFQRLRNIARNKKAGATDPNIENFHKKIQKSFHNLLNL